jgi:F0F1-type ATP synthase epsilon subunit
VAEEAVPVSDLDIGAARAGLEAANAKLNSADPLEKAEAEISHEVHTAMLVALA